MKKILAAATLALITMFTFAKDEVKKEPETVVMSVEDARKLAAEIDLILKQRNEAISQVLRLMKERDALAKRTCI
jgi:hypothetical protein